MAEETGQGTFAAMHEHGKLRPALYLKDCVKSLQSRSISAECKRQKVT